MNDILKEKTVHGTKSFPFKMYYPCVLNSSNALHMHWHYELEIIYITKGSARYRIDNVTYTAREGNILIISPELLHCANNYSTQNCEHIALLFDISFLSSKSMDSCTEKYILPIKNGEFYFEPFCESDEILKASIETIKKAYDNKPFGYELKIKKELFTIIDRLFDLNFVKSKLNTSEKFLIKNILLEIETHFCEQIYISELAAKLNYSESHISKSFKAYTGLTIVEYINNLRLTLAVELILVSDLSITEIALCVGFNNMSYFSKTFRNKYGVTPKEYKKTYK